MVNRTSVSYTHLDVYKRQPYTLRLPIEAISTFIDRQDTIFAHRADELFRNRKTVAVKEISPSTRRATTAVAGKGKPTYYKIKDVYKRQPICCS